MKSICETYKREGRGVGTADVVIDFILWSEIQKEKKRQFIIKLIKNDTSSYKNHNLFSELSPGDLVPDHHIHYSTLFHKNLFC